MKKSTKLLSLILTLVMMLSIIIIGIPYVSAIGYSAHFDYSFATNDPGFAEGTLYFLMPPDGNSIGGTYTLYWADDEKALEGYAPIGELRESGSDSFHMPAHTVIPPDAQYVIAVKGNDLSVVNAYAAYEIPEHKRLSFTSDDALYTFGAISDPQIANDSYGSGSYPYDEDHLRAALETLAERNVDFTVSSGDTVNDQNGKQTYAAEYRTYQRILADSPYNKPIYEANGNHDVGTVWNKNGNYYNDDKPFIMATGLDSKAETINAGKPYFEVTEPTTGDHFIFMALEGGFYTNKGTQFSKAQLDWLEGLLKKYSGDGKNIFIVEHANITGWGSGDKLTTPYYYDLALEKNNADVTRFVKLMETYKECVIITGHTHLELSAQYNYSDNNGTSAVMMHNSAIGGVRRLINGKVDRTAVLGLSEGYIVEVYEDAILFNGTNMYKNEIMPQCCYIIPFGTSVDENYTEPILPTYPEDPSQTEKTEPSTTTPPTESDTTAPTEKTEPSTATPPTGPDTTVPTEATEPTETDPIPEYKFGDTDLNGSVNVKDATAVQKHVASLLTLEGVALIQADVTADGSVNVKDATSIQKYVAGMITAFPAENKKDIAETGAIAPHYQRAKDVLEDYYTYSSYDQYAALKWAFRTSWFYRPEVDVPTLLLDRENDFMALINDIGGTTSPEEVGELNIYFSNNKKWSSVYAYVWGSDGKPAEWPGTKMTKVSTNSMGEDIYHIKVDLSKYQNIIFTNGSGAQTEDIVINESDNTGYYISGGSSNKYTCETYTYA